jgi:hypothetical protein
MDASLQGPVDNYFKKKIVSIEQVTINLGLQVKKQTQARPPEPFNTSYMNIRGYDATCLDN